LYDYIKVLFLGVALLQRTQEVVPNCPVTILRPAVEALDAAPDSVCIYRRFDIAKEVPSDAKEFLTLLLKLSSETRVFLSQKMEKAVCGNGSGSNSYNHRCDKSYASPSKPRSGTDQESRQSCVISGPEIARCRWSFRCSVNIDGKHIVDLLR